MYNARKQNEANHRVLHPPIVVDRRPSVSGKWKAL
ncbi:hypothetical protein OROGR_003145 [Orobanche gracilis]